MKGIPLVGLELREADRGMELHVRGSGWRWVPRIPVKGGSPKGIQGLREGSEYGSPGGVVLQGVR